MSRICLIAILVGASLSFAVPGVHITNLNNFDSLAAYNMRVDNVPRDGSAGLSMNADSRFAFGGKGGSIKVDLVIPPSKVIRVGQEYGQADFSCFDTLVYRFYPVQAGAGVLFFYQTGIDWIRTDYDSMPLEAGKWNVLKVALKKKPDVNFKKTMFIGLSFYPLQSQKGFTGSIYIDDICGIGTELFGRDKAMTTPSGFQNVTSTQSVAIHIDGAIAHGKVKPGIISFNRGANTFNNPYYSRLLKEAGPGVMRMWGNEMSFNPAEGKYNWSVVDSEMIHLVSIGWEPMICLGEVQRWNVNPQRKIPADFKKWAKMAGDVVRHYNKDLKLNLTHWEIWNEHDLSMFWGGSESEYRELMALASAEMKAADSTIHIYAGAYANPAVVAYRGATMLDSVPPKGHYDGISWHNYLSGDPTTSAGYVMKSVPYLEAPAYAAWKILKDRNLDKTMELGMSEASMWAGMDVDWRLEQMLGAVYWSSALLHLIRQNVSLATHFVSCGGDLWGEITDHARPVYYTEKHFNHTVNVVGKQWLETSFDEIANASLDAVAFASDKEFSMVLVNRDTSGKAYSADVKFDNLAGLSRISRIVQKDGALAGAKADDIVVQNGKAQIACPPFSVTYLTGALASVRPLAKITEYIPQNKEIVGRFVVGQYTWNGTPAQITRVKQAVVMDGRVDQFKAYPTIDLIPNDPRKVVYGSVAGATELSAKVWVLYDSAYLYLAGSVTQGRSAKNANVAADIWNGDNIEFYISTKTSMASKSRPVKSEWDYQICVAPTTKSGKPSMVCYNSTDIVGTVSASIDSAKGYSVIAKMPLSKFPGFDWASGKTARFDVAVTKADAESKRDKKMFWNASIDAWDSPDAWGLAQIK